MEYTQVLNQSKIESRYLNDIRKEIANLSQYNVDKSTIEEVLYKINTIESDADGQSVDVVVLGNFNSGKTSLLNAIIATVTKNFEALLPSSQLENTYYITIIENSNDSYFHVDYSKDGIIYESNQFSSIEELSIDLDKLDENSSDYLNLIKEAEIEGENQKEKNKNEIPDIKVKIKIPNFWKNIRLIDTPGLTARIIRERLYKVLRQSLFPIFIFVRSIIQEQIVENVTTSILNYLKDNFKDGVVILNLSKKDVLIGKIAEVNDSKQKKIRNSNLRENIRNVDKYSKNFNYFFMNILENEHSNSFYFTKMVFLNSHGIFDEDESSIAEMQNFVGYLESLPKTKGEKLKICNYRYKLNYLIDELNNKLSNVSILTKKEIQTFKETAEFSIYEFEKSLNNWINSIEKYEDFYHRYNLKLERIHKRFIEIDQTVLGEKKYMRRNTYIQDQLNELSEDFEKLITTDIQNLVKHSIEKFWLKLPTELRVKLLKYFEDLGIMKRNQDGWLIFAFFILTLVITVGSRLLIGLAIEGLTIAAGVAWIPVVGWIAGAVIGVGTLIVSCANLMGLWSRENCWEDIVKCCHNNFSRLRYEIAENAIKQYKEMTESVIKKLSEGHQILPEIKNITLINENYQSENEVNTSSRYLLTEEITNLANEDNRSNLLKTFIEGSLQNKNNNY